MRQVPRRCAPNDDGAAGLVVVLWAVQLVERTT